MLWGAPGFEEIGVGRGVVRAMGTNLLGTEREGWKVAITS